MKKKALVLFFTIVFTGNAFGWAVSGSYGNHHSLTDAIFDMYCILPYVDKLEQFGIDVNNVIDLSHYEPQGDDHLTWYSGHHLYPIMTPQLTDVGIRNIIHGMQDSSVPAIHGPGGDLNENMDAHDFIEDTGRDKSHLPGIIDDAAFENYQDLMLTGDWIDKCSTYLATSNTNALNYKSWFDNTSNPEWELLLNSHVIDTYLQAGMDQAVVMTTAALTTMFDYHEVAEPGTTVARWSFDESDGQIAYNSKGSLSATLMYGYSTGTDSKDPQHATGYFGNAIQCERYDNNNDTPTHARQLSNWTEHEEWAVIPEASFTVEVVFSVDTYPACTLDDTIRRMGFLRCADYAPSPDMIHYQLSTFAEDFSGDVRRVFQYRSHDANGTLNSLTLDPEANGMTISTNTWYYLAATYDYLAKTIELLIRDIDTGQTFSQTFVNINPPVRPSENPSPWYLIGSEYVASRSLDGLIDEVRISNVALPDKDRICPATIAHWDFDEEPGQIVHSHTELHDFDLRLGSSTGSDDYEPDWQTDTGIFGGAIESEAFADNNDKSTNARDNAWTQSQFETIMPQGSYSIEVVFNVESYPDYTLDFNDKCLGIMRCSDYNGKIMYRLTTYMNVNNDNALVFYSQHDDGTSSELYYVNNSVEIVPGNWYYANITYDDDTNQATLMLRDMETGSSDSVTGAMYPMATMTSSPAPHFVVGSEYLGTGRSFNGFIDEVRISNSAIPEKDRLYNFCNTVAHWSMDINHATTCQVVDNRVYRKINGKPILGNLKCGETLNVYEYTNPPQAASIITDSYEPSYVFSLYGSGILGKSYYDNNNMSTNIRSDHWSDAEYDALRISGSYTIEAIFNVDEYPVYTDSSANKNMGILRYVDYNGKILYRLTTYKNVNNDTALVFYSEHDDGTSNDVYYVNEAVDIIPGQWYYVNVTYDDSANEATIYLRDLVTGNYASDTEAMYPMASFSASPNLYFIIGSEYLGGGRSFDGIIDEVRVSKGILPEDIWLYNLYEDSLN